MANKYTDREIMNMNYVQSDNVNAAQNKMNAAQSAYDSIGDFNYGRQTDYDKAIDAALNRKAFSYDLNGDALYQQYKDNYINQGKQAMMDTMGQAAAMTGGYGNSYAQTVGQQTYQNHLQGLNDIVPQLYQMALDRYNAEGDRLMNNYNLLNTDRQTAYGEWSDKKNFAAADLDRAINYFNNERDFDYNSYSDMVSVNNDNYWKEYSAGYQENQDRIAQENWQKEYDLNARQVAASEAAAAAADKSAKYEAEIAALNEKYSTYLSPEMQKAASSKATQLFDASILTPNELAQRKYTTTINGKTMRFDNHSQYVDAVLEKWKKDNKLTENEVAYLKGAYGID